MRGAGEGGSYACFCLVRYKQNSVAAPKAECGRKDPLHHAQSAPTVLCQAASGPMTFLSGARVVYDLRHGPSKFVGADSCSPVSWRIFKESALRTDNAECRSLIIVRRRFRSDMPDMGSPSKTRRPRVHLCAVCMLFGLTATLDELTT